MKKHKFTWIDAMVIAVIVLLVIGTCVKFFFRENTSVQNETQEIQIQLKIEQVRQFSINALQVGDIVYATTGKGQIGTITDIQVEPYKDLYETADGRLIEAEVENVYNIILTLSAEGFASGGSYKVGTNTVYLDQLVNYFTKYLAFEATTLSID